MTTSTAADVDVESGNRTMDVENRYNNNANGKVSSSKETSAVAGGDGDDEQVGSSKSVNAVAFAPEMLSAYYSRLFPFDMVHQWLSYGGGSNNNKMFSHREFSFTINPGGEEIYIRHQSFPTGADLARAVRRRRPIKIDIGAVFTHPPIDKNTAGAVSPQSRELVFDIDLTDYDAIRRCGCAGAAICPVCWTYMAMAVRVMDRGLREDFGFHHIAWFYSGRRGIHCWVCDESARALTDPGRSAVANYFQVCVCVAFYLVLCCSGAKDRQCDFVSSFWRMFCRPSAKLFAPNPPLTVFLSLTPKKRSITAPTRTRTSLSLIPSTQCWNARTTFSNLCSFSMSSPRRDMDCWQRKRAGPISSKPSRNPDPRCASTC
jgi:DNA primase small subunit